MPSPGKVPPELEGIVEQALVEDIGAGDCTTESLIPPTKMATATISFRTRGIVAGGVVCEEVLKHLDPKATVTQNIAEGDWAEVDAPIVTMHATAGAILTGERLMLNLIARMSGIATLTSKYVAEVAGTNVKILDTRKTTPLLRALEKYSVRAGGGVSHRMGLFDAVLIKDNHLDLLQCSAAEAVAKSRANGQSKIEIEVTTLEDALKCVELKADTIMLDNFTPQAALDAVKEIRAVAAPELKIEISGGITLENLAEYAKAEPDFISIGALTHSATSLDVTLDLTPL